jgi:hypothetical protein
MSSLKASLESLAAGFAIDVVRAIQGASLLELRREVVGSSIRERTRAESPPLRLVKRMVKPSSSGRLRRRSSEDIAAVLESVIKLLRNHTSGLAAEQIRGTLQMQSREMPRILSDGLRRGTLRKEGQKRATKYFAV